MASVPGLSYDVVYGQRNDDIKTKKPLKTSVYPAKGRPGSGTTKLNSDAQKRLRRSRIEGYGTRPQARAQLARAAVVTPASA